MKGKSWFHDQAFAVNITAQLIDLNLTLLGKNKLIAQLCDDFKYFNSIFSLQNSQI